MWSRFDGNRYVALGLPLQTGKVVARFSPKITKLTGFRKKMLRNLYVEQIWRKSVPILAAYQLRYQMSYIEYHFHLKRVLIGLMALPSMCDCPHLRAGCTLQPNRAIWRVWTLMSANVVFANILKNIRVSAEWVKNRDRRLNLLSTTKFTIDD